jgi:hypothetical protein
VVARTLKNRDDVPKNKKTRFGQAVAGLEVVEPMGLRCYSVDAPCPRECAQHMHIEQAMLRARRRWEERRELMKGVF